MQEEEHRIHLDTNLILDLDAQAVIREDSAVPLPAIEFRLLSYMAHHMGQVISAETLISIAWPDGWPRGAQDLYYHIHRARKIIGDTQHPFRVVQSRRGSGYLLIRHQD